MALDSGTGKESGINHDREDEDADAILASLEVEDSGAYRARRLEELKNAAGASAGTTTFATVKKAYITLSSDDEALAFTTEHERAVLHFFHPEFARCNTMDTHCELIAEKHAEYGNADVSFARVDVKNAPFVVEKLRVRVLPCVIGFVKGAVKGRVTGFEGLCWDGKEGSVDVTRALEDVLLGWKVLTKRLLLGHEDERSDDNEEAPDHRKAVRGAIRSRNQKNEDDDDDWD
ncbi:uncharacterized protein Z520_07621 [Fonsecaea multimorphosa CBS 102226]|uniref:Thioredoxin domain-containing protein n=1 Tax=Fonsecaea multimorphosa CBS 102226 TaxID=1442371 RepID=A0A0D2IIT7_9EURO|nr:uncharacterized protein Z520_07621 [Fonsecaea multimorphosa CBS 102226]KIX96901.1 hypothetical protein Z520_07621 [Fonsecaea multimorphosa CBS 102226]OAL22577.1 hypothetical protein AYO22_07135 [Fonsecaea multimorphosa]